MKTEVLDVRKAAFSKKIILHIVSILKSGGLIIFPTDTVYGIGANALCADAVRRIFRIKKRSPQKSFLVNVGSIRQIKECASARPPAAVLLERHFSPGALSIVYHASDNLPSFLTGKSRKIGIRIPAHPTALKLLRVCDFPLVSTSASISGKPVPQTADELYRLFNGKVALILDAGKSAGVPSTVVDVTVTPPVILREGAVSALAVRKVLKQVFSA